MKLLVVSHACVTAINQAFFSEVQDLTKWELELLMPTRWKTEYSSKPTCPGVWPESKARIRTMPVVFSGSVPLHAYSNFLLGYLKRTNPDVIYVHNEPYALGTSQLYAANRLTNRRPIGFYTAQNIQKRYPFPFRNLEAWVYRQSSFALPVTEGALSVTRSKGYAGPAVVLPLALDRTVYKPQPEWATSKRTELGINPEETIIGFIGRLVEEKGVQTLLEALPLLENRSYRCVIVGSGPHEQHLRQLAAQRWRNGEIIFQGFVPHSEAPKWLSLFDICVLPSQTRPNWKEQFGRVITEAIACGTPVVGSDSGEIPAVLRKTGGADEIFAEGDALDLARKLQRLCDLPYLRERLVKQGQQVIRDCYDQRRLAAGFASTIELVYSGQHELCE